jgi:peptide subunit release factor 1 (eRF1)
MFDEFKTQITKELSTAVNIKDKKNRKKVISSLKSIKHFLKRIKHNYISNGLVIYSGVDINNQIIFEYHFMNVPLKQGFYYCDKKFHTDFLQPYCEIKDKYLIVYLTGTETFYYEKKLTQMKLLKKISFERQKKQKKGGQSQARIARLREEKIIRFANKSFEFLNTYKNNSKYKSIIIAGNGSIIDYIKHKTKEPTIKVSSRNQLLEKCNEFINNTDTDFGNDKIQKYMGMMSLCDEKLVYGGMYILNLIKQNLIEEILIHKESKYFSQLKNFKKKIIIRNGTQDGDVFLQNFEGILAKLYFKID